MPQCYVGMTAKFKHDQPFHSVTLLPVEDPSTEQILTVRELSKIQHENLLALRFVLKEGGFKTFGLLLAEQAAAIGKRQGDAGIPCRIERLQDRRHVRE
jgi:hypothetical protein